MIARSVLALCALCAAGTWTVSAQQPRTHGRLFPPQDLGLLEAPDRDQWQRPDRIMDVLKIADASVVGDVALAVDGSPSASLAAWVRRVWSTPKTCSRRC